MQVLNLLKTQFKKGTPTHAYVLECEKGLAKQLLKDCAKVAMCSNFGCGNCNVCNKVEKNIHADCISLPLDVQKNKLTVVDVQFLVEESIKCPVDSGNVRVFTIDATDSVTGVGSAIWQNKLLKTLEEPLPNVYIFIAVENAHSLFNTVLSRCQVLTQPKATSASVYSKLLNGGYQPQYAQFAAAMGSSLANAEKILADNSYFNALGYGWDFLTKITSTKNALPVVSAICLDNSCHDKVLQVLTLLLRESLLYRLSPQSCLLSYYESQTKQVCANYSIEAARVCIENKSNKQARAKRRKLYRGNGQACNRNVGG